MTKTGAERFSTLSTRLTAPCDHTPLAPRCRACAPAHIGLARIVTFLKEREAKANGHVTSHQQTLASPKRSADILCRGPSVPDRERSPWFACACGHGDYGGNASRALSRTLVIGCFRVPTGRTGIRPPTASEPVSEWDRTYRRRSGPPASLARGWRPAQPACGQRNHSLALRVMMQRAQPRHYGKTEPRQRCSLAGLPLYRPFTER
jgi:hypothetical protein